MKTPPLLLGLALLFWGWQVGLLPVAFFLAVGLEAARITPARWTFSEGDYRRLWNLCTLLFLGATVYAFLANEGASGFATLFEDTSFANRSEALNKTTRSVLVLLQWLPMVFSPMMAAQAYSSAPAIDARVFSWLLRRERLVRAAGLGTPHVNVSGPYFAVCLLAASAAHSQTRWFYLGLSLLLAWALWSLRDRRFSPAHWSLAFGMVIACGYGLQEGLVQMQRVVQNLDAAWLSRFTRQRVDDRGSRTAIGTTGRLSLSGRIVMRVDPGAGPVPPLLREASYNLFKSPLWYVGLKEFASVQQELDETTWHLHAQARSGRRVRIARYLPHGSGCLAAPNGTYQFQELPVFLLRTNGMGVFRVDAGPGLVDYVASYARGAGTDSPPGLDDLSIPASEQPALNQVANQLGLAAKTPAQVLQTVSAFFANQFVYSTHLEADVDSQSGQTPLGEFLLERRAGHCEYFATATVLLLREAGLPARYAVGYAVQEPSGKKYLVRERHAHAWCLVYRDGAWRDFDTTPPGWAALEAEQAPPWEKLYDAWSSLWFQFSKWRWGKSGVRKYLLWLLLPLLLLVTGRLFFRRQWSRWRRDHPVPASAPAWPGRDSEFYLAEQRLIDWGYARHAGEPLSNWLQRIAQPGLPGHQALPRMLALHYRYRFDPLGLTEPDRLALHQAVHAWLHQTDSLTH